MSSAASGDRTMRAPCGAACRACLPAARRPERPRGRQLTRAPGPSRRRPVRCRDERLGGLLAPAIEDLDRRGAAEQGRDKRRIGDPAKGDGVLQRPRHRSGATGSRRHRREFSSRARMRSVWPFPSKPPAPRMQSLSAISPPCPRDGGWPKSWVQPDRMDGAAIGQKRRGRMIRIGLLRSWARAMPPATVGNLERVRRARVLSKSLSPRLRSGSCPGAAGMKPNE